MNEDKAALRKQMRALQSEFFTSAEFAASENDRILSELEGSELFQSSGTILLYMSIAGEVATIDFINKWAAFKRIAIPLVKGEELILKEYDASKLKTGYKGILEPGDDAVTINTDEIELAVVPGVAFTKDGCRMGRGKGFYDRLLPLLNCPKVGICFPFRIVASLPLDPWDSKLDSVIY